MELSLSGLGIGITVASCHIVGNVPDFQMSLKMFKRVIREDNESFQTCGFKAFYVTYEGKFAVKYYSKEFCFCYNLDWFITEIK